MWVPISRAGGGGGLGTRGVRVWCRVDDACKVGHTTTAKCAGKLIRLLLLLESDCRFFVENFLFYFWVEDFFVDVVLQLSLSLFLL